MYGIMYEGRYYWMYFRRNSWTEVDKATLADAIYCQSLKQTNENEEKDAFVDKWTKK